jgi:purine-nucleoside phosphorylase
MNVKDELKKIEEAKDYLLSVFSTFPKAVLALGSGLAGVVDEMQIEKEIAFRSIPHFKTSSVLGHNNRILTGRLGGVRMAVMQGRIHYYEGYTPWEVVFPVRALAQAGAEMFFLTNAAGGMHLRYTPGQLVSVKDHINFTGYNPLIGPNLEPLGPRFNDMTEAYDKELRFLLQQEAKRIGYVLEEGVYVGLHGPSFETPTEIEMYRKMGGDLVGMSTVPEVIALRHMNKKVVTLSCVSNLAAGMEGANLDHNSVLDAVKVSHSVLVKLVSGVVAKKGMQ